MCISAKDDSLSWPMHVLLCDILDIFTLMEMLMRIRINGSGYKSAVGFSLSANTVVAIITAISIASFNYHCLVLTIYWYPSL